MFGPTRGAATRALGAGFYLWPELRARDRAKAGQFHASLLGCALEPLAEGAALLSLDNRAFAAIVELSDDERALGLADHWRLYLVKGSKVRRGGGTSPAGPRELSGRDDRSAAGRSAGRETLRGPLRRRPRGSAVDRARGRGRREGGLDAAAGGDERAARRRPRARKERQPRHLLQRRSRRSRGDIGRRGRLARDPGLEHLPGRRRLRGGVGARSPRRRNDCGKSSRAGDRRAARGSHRSGGRTVLLLATFRNYSRSNPGDGRPELGRAMGRRIGRGASSGEAVLTLRSCREL